MTFRVWCLYRYLVHGSKTIHGRLLILFFDFLCVSEKFEALFVYKCCQLYVLCCVSVNRILLLYCLSPRMKLELFYLRWGLETFFRPFDSARICGDICMARIFTIVYFEWTIISWLADSTNIYFTVLFKKLKCLEKNDYNVIEVYVSFNIRVCFLNVFSLFWKRLYLSHLVFMYKKFVS